MCGILGFSFPENFCPSRNDLEGILKSLYQLTESRGKEAAGLSALSNGTVFVHKACQAATKMIRTKQYHQKLRAALDMAFDVRGQISAPFAVIGHSRLVTSGTEEENNNNQPMAAGEITLVHNGIVVNEKALWDLGLKYDKKTECDSEVLVSLIAGFVDEDKSLADAVAETLRLNEGEASIAAFCRSLGQLVLATNTGSIYYLKGVTGKGLLFASESYILEEFLRKKTYLVRYLNFDIIRIPPKTGLVLDIKTGEFTTFLYDQNIQEIPRNKYPRYSMEDPNFPAPPLPQLKRCSVTILPETMPYITFDEHGVSNYAKSFKKKELAGKDALLKVLAKYRNSSSNHPDCLVAFSGGRDSSYGMHLLKTELGMNPIAYTYDWGMVTDLARRNQARLCGRLNIEHVWVSADIRKKRHYIGQNVNAWMRKPELGMIPLFMAGDKAYFYYAMRIMKQLGIKLMVFFSNHYETTYFKTGFCGLKPSDKKERPGEIKLYEKLGLLYYYSRNFLTNPSYLNKSILDTAFAYWSYYLQRTDFVRPFNYIPWREDEINSLLCDEYDWEVSEDTTTTWRIGDGTAAFYNYVYHSVAGFSEHDSFRSNQILDNALERDKALQLVAYENMPRWQSIKEYCKMINVDFNMLIDTVESIPKLF